MRVWVRAVQFQGEDFAAPEQVVVADLEGDARTDEAVRLGGYVGLQRRFQRIVELGVDDHVQRVGAPQRVERRDAQIDRAENGSCAIPAIRCIALIPPMWQTLSWCRISPMFRQPCGPILWMMTS